MRRKNVEVPANVLLEELEQNFTPDNKRRERSPSRCVRGRGRGRTYQELFSSRSWDRARTVQPLKAKRSTEDGKTWQARAVGSSKPPAPPMSEFGGPGTHVSSTLSAPRRVMGT